MKKNSFLFVCALSYFPLISSYEENLNFTEQQISDQKERIEFFEKTSHTIGCIILGFGAGRFTGTKLLRPIITLFVGAYTVSKNTEVAALIEKTPWNEKLFEKMKKNGDFLKNFAGLLTEGIKKEVREIFEPFMEKKDK